MQISEDLDMLYQRNLEIQQIAESIIEGIETQNRTMMSKLGFLEPKSRELVEEISRNKENEVRKLIGTLVEGIWDQQCQMMDMAEYARKFGYRRRKAMAIENS
jgi:hypothetical protein